VYEVAPLIAVHDTVILLYAVAVALLIVGAPGGVVCAAAVIDPPSVVPFELLLIEYTVNVPYDVLAARPLYILIRPVMPDVVARLVPAVVYDVAPFAAVHPSVS
jgi:hypothetical protein